MSDAPSMIDTASVDELVDEFRQFLQQARETPEEAEAGTDNERVDLFRLFTELAALKSEIKLESRQVKEAIDRFGALFDTLREHNRRLTQDLAREQDRNAEQLRAQKKPLLLEIIDIKDRLESTLASLRSYRPTWCERRMARATEFRQSLLEGLEITMRRLDQLLANHDVTRLKTLGLPLDPHSMRVAEVRADPRQGDGVVIDELRAGYKLGDDILRLAEVVVNRHKKK